MATDVVTVRIRDAGFTQSLRKYASLSKRTPAEICNRKSYMINRRAIWNTRKAEAEKVKQELGAHDATNLVVNKSGKRKGLFSRARKHATYVFDRAGDGMSRLERILVARMKKAGQQIPGAEALAELAIKVLKARLRSIAFIKSGFIPARDRFKNWCLAHGVSIGKAGLPPSVGSGIGEPKTVGSVKGGASPANFNWYAKATFYNGASAKHDTKGALSKFGGDGLQQAFAEETADTLQEIERRLKQHAAASGIRIA